MKVYEMKCGEMDYPVGYTIQKNLPIITQMSKTLQAVLAENKFSKSHYNINLFCMGSSGACISALISADLFRKDWNVRIIHYKKDGEQSHSSNGYSGLPGINIYVDDFISSGSTMLKIHELNGERQPFCVLVSGSVHYDSSVIEKTNPLNLICSNCNNQPITTFKT
jgi:hypothetical protein